MPETTIAPTMSPARTSAAGLREKTGDQQRAADDLDHANHDDEHVRSRQRVRLERGKLRGVIDELARAEDDEHAAR